MQSPIIPCTLTNSVQGIVHYLRFNSLLEIRTLHSVLVNNADFSHLLICK